jgi:hypothetical protein
MWKKGYKQSPEHTEKIAASRRREKHHNWKGGQKKTGAGYWRVLCPLHPNADANGRVLRHRLIMEAYMGRVLLPTEVVHHINGDKEDDRIENLMLYSSASEHTSFHRNGGTK